MEAELPKEFDVIVVGTGLVECIVAAASARIGKKVLHLDKNDYYGSQWASFSLQGVEQWVEDVKTLQEDTSKGTCDLEEGERLVTTFDPRKAYSKVKLAWHVPKVIEPCLSASTSSSVNDKPQESSSDKEKVTPPSASSDSQTSGADDPGVGSNEKKDAEPKTKDSVPKEEVEEKWSQERMMNLSRKFNLDLAPKLLFSRGPLVELLISSNVARYAEFKCITRVLTWRPSNKKEGELLVVPCSRSDVFTTSSVSLVEKRLLMKFLEFCLSYDDNPEQLQEKDL